MVTSVNNWIYQKQSIKAMHNEMRTNVVFSYFADKIQSSLARVEQSFLETY